ncbi:hypothetical protein AB0436_07735 [Streptomyces sp. NPDC051322]|uniref:hypothetical protein n=1 Tax=Streptomyces sp. NPDC051322 TaxID=3154645 RepID=UPI00344EFA18
MKRHPAFLVVAGWGLLNGILLAVLAIYGESSLVYWLWGGVVVLIELAALAVLLSSLTGPEQHRRYRLPAKGEAAALPTALGAAIVGLSFIYGFWLIALAAPLLALALVLRVRRGPLEKEELPRGD